MPQKKHRKNIKNKKRGSFLKKKENRIKLCIVLRDIFHICKRHTEEYFNDVTGAASSNRKVAKKNASGNNIQKLVDGFFLTHDKELLAEIIKISQKKNAPLNELIGEDYIKNKMQPFYSFDDEEQIIECTFVFIYYNGTFIRTRGELDSLINKCKSDPQFLPKGWIYTKTLKFLFFNGKPINGVVRLDAPASAALFCAIKLFDIKNIIINTSLKLHWYLSVGKDKTVEKKYFGKMASALDEKNIEVRNLKQNVNKVNLLSK